MKESRPFSSKDIIALTNLTYRTLTDWDSKGVLPSGREEKKGWRRYSIEEVFITLIIDEIRSQFGVPISRLRWLKKKMSEYEGGYLPKALGLMQAFGAPVFILTDLKSYFRMCSFIELLDLTLDKFFDGDDKEGFILFKVNPLVNRLLEALGASALNNHGLGYKIYWKALEKGIGQTPDESDLLNMVRDRATSRLEVKLDNGTIVQSSRERDLGSLNPEKLIDTLNSADFQTLTVKKHEGKIVGVQQKIPEKKSRRTSGKKTKGTPRKRS